MEKIPAKSVAVVCEYNPYHYGHKYQTELLSKEYETVVGIMSGDFVQRGEVAVADKYLRAAVAVDNGMNLILELPFPYCCLSARDFAFSAVQIAVSAGVDAMAFGAEAGDDGKELLFEIAELIGRESFESDLKSTIKGQGGLSYARARALLVSEKLGLEAGEMLSKPNNILAVEYIRAANILGSSLEIRVIKRESGFSSSSAIREKLFSGGGLEEEIPTAERFLSLSEHEFPRRLKNAERAIFAVLRSKTAEGLENIYGMDEGLACAILEGAEKTASLEELYTFCTGKVYTLSRVRRGVLCAVLGVTEFEAHQKPVFTLLLGADEKGCAFLAERRRDETAFPIITKPAVVKSLSAEICQSFERGIKASAFAELCAPELLPAVSHYRKTPYIKR